MKQVATVIKKIRNGGLCFGGSDCRSFPRDTAGECLIDKRIW